MLHMTNHQNQLPQGFLDELDPKLVELYSSLSLAGAARIEVLVRKAPHVAISPARLFKYAFLFARAESQVQGDDVSEDHGARSRLELAAALHGLPADYSDPAEVMRRYKAGRRARQQIKASIDAVVGEWRRLEQVVQRHRAKLPLHLHSRFTDKTMSDVQKVLHNMGNATVLDEEDLVNKRAGERKLSVNAQTYVWWCLALPTYRGKWNDMHQLAFAWKMSPTASVKRFRFVVERICKGATHSYPLERSLESVLSEK
jgi:hypothetical protein